MSWKNTGILFGLAALLLGFIFFFERHTRSTNSGAEPPARLIALNPLEVTNLVLRRTNQLVLRAERAAQHWQLSFPLAYPAQQVAIERLLHSLANLSSHTVISREDLAARQRTIAEFGLDVPQATLLIQQQSGTRMELMFGSKTAVGDQVYLQVFDAPGIYVVSAELVDMLPRNANDWRDTALTKIAELNPTRIEARIPGRGFTIEASPTNNVLYLTRPSRARASLEKVAALIRKIQTAQVHRFVTDDPRADLDTYGLRPPAAELAFGQGSNDVLVVQFGSSPADEPGLVYARRLSQTNIVLVPKTVLEAVQISHVELRDRHLMAFTPSLVETIEFQGEEPFTVRRLTNGLWAVTEPQNTMADAELVQNWISHLHLLQGQVEMDVVTDLAPFGLAPPARQYVLKTSMTNATGGITNRVMAQLNLSTPREGKIYARGSLDESVYSIGSGDYDRLPSAAWQMRDRRVWTFTPAQVTRATFFFEGQTRQLIRGPSGDWSFAAGSQGVITPETLEKLMQQLGELRANVWAARGEDQREHFGFGTTNNQKIVIEVKQGERSRTLSLEFGGRSPLQIPYALSQFDNQTWIYEFPVPLFYDLARFTSQLFVPPRSASR